MSEVNAVQKANMPEINAQAAIVVTQHDGKILLDGTPDQIFENEALLKSCGLAVPQGTELIHRLRDAGIALDGKCVDIEECACLIANALKK